jgi:hypothetical protein
MLQQQFMLDDTTFGELKDALLYAHPDDIMADDSGQGLVWQGAMRSTQSLGYLIHLLANKYLLAIPVWFYIVGLVISNIYLDSLGVISFDVLQRRYISIGVLGTIFFSISIIHAYINFKFVVDNPRTRWMSASFFIFSIESFFIIEIFVWIMLSQASGEDTYIFGRTLDTIETWLFFTSPITIWLY